VSAYHSRISDTKATVPPGPLPAERVLEIVGSKLAEFGSEWVLEPGPLLRGPQTLAVRLGTPHSDSFRHVDLEFLVGVGLPAETVIPDCASGLAADPEEAVRQAVASWADTTGCVVLEFTEQRGRLATHFPPGAGGGFPGWHAIIGSASGWGFGDESSLKQQWFADTSPWIELAPLITAGLDRQYLNGVRLYVGQGRDYQSCEVKINGHLDDASTAALSAMSWPRTVRMSGARVFLLLVHPSDDGG
jgi:hypothetical protein